MARSDEDDGEDGTLIPEEVTTQTDIDQLEDPLADEFQKIVNSGDGVRVEVFRLSGTDIRGPKQYLYQEPLDVFDYDSFQDHLRDTYGSGNYLVIVRGKKGVIRLRRKYSVASVPRAAQGANDFSAAVQAITDKQVDLMKSILHHGGDRGDGGAMTTLGTMMTAVMQSQAESARQAQTQMMQFMALLQQQNSSNLAAIQNQTNKMFEMVFLMNNNKKDNGGFNEIFGMAEKIAGYISGGKNEPEDERETSTVDRIIDRIAPIAASLIDVQKLKLAQGLSQAPARVGEQK